MKRFCKSVDITDVAFIRDAVLLCLDKSSKRKRPDTVRLFAEVGGLSRTAARKVLTERGELYDKIVDVIAAMMRAEISNERLTLPEVHIYEKEDGHSGKVRKLSVQEIRQLLYDHVAVVALSELNRLMGEHQVSGRKGLGTSYGHNLMRRWVVHAGKKLYFAKLDIRNYYGSVDTAALMTWLARRVKNEKLLWLVETLVNTGDTGLNIGSYLSHYLANLYLSDVWHFAKQRADGIDHALFYMDDMVLIGGNRRTLLRGVRQVVDMVEAKGLVVKDKWQVHRCTVRHPMDVMGIRFSPEAYTLRRRIFKRARRAVIRTRRMLRGRLKPNMRVARRLASFHGWLRRAECSGFSLRTREHRTLKRIFKQLKKH